MSCVTFNTACGFAISIHLSSLHNTTHFSIHALFIQREWKKIHGWYVTQQPLTCGNSSDLNIAQ